MLSEFMKKDMTRIRNKSAFVNGIIDRVHKELAHDKVLMYVCRLLRSLACFSQPFLSVCVAILRSLPLCVASGPCSHAALLSCVAHNLTHTMSPLLS